MKEKTTKITDILALLVFVLFALCTLMVLLTGARGYRKLVSDGEELYETRTAVRYLTTRVRQAESIWVEDFDGCDALVAEETIDGERYLTRVYLYEGFLRELFCPENAQLTPADGEKVIEAVSVTFSMERGILTVNLDGQELILSLRGKEW